MGESQSKDFFKIKQRRAYSKKNNTTAISIRTNSSIITSFSQRKLSRIRTSHRNATSLAANGEDPAIIGINQHPSSLIHQTKEKKAKVCCVL